MVDFAEVIGRIGHALGIGWWTIDIDRRTISLPKRLGAPPGDGDSGYATVPLDRAYAMIPEADLGRFRGFLADILQARGERSLDIGFDAPWGARLQLRLVGRQVGQGRDSRIVGLVEEVTHLRATERLAKSLSFIVEALFISSDSGIIIFDSHLRVRRLNRHALELFGVTDEEEAEFAWTPAIERKLPKTTRETLLEAIAGSTAVSGTLSLGGLGGPRLSWRANPWGDGGGDLAGLVMVVDAKRPPRAADLAERAAEKVEDSAPIVVPEADPRLPPPPTKRGGDDRGHRALEWVKHPILLVSIRTGEIAFANRAARDFFHLPGDRRSFVENVYDVSGFDCDVDALAIVAGGGHVLRLRLGARVGRMLDYDEDLLFVEYHSDVFRPRPTPVVVSHAAR